MASRVNTSRQGGLSSFAVLCIVCAVLQIALSTQVSILGGSFNFAIAFVAVVAFMGDASRTVICGFAAGLLYGLVTSTPVGLMALVLTVGGFVFSKFIQGSAGMATMQKVAATAGFAFAANLIFGILLFAMGEQSSIVDVIFGHTFAGTVLTALASWPLLALFGTTQASMYGLSRGSSVPSFKGRAGAHATSMNVSKFSMKSSGKRFGAPAKRKPSKTPKSSKRGGGLRFK